MKRFLFGIALASTLIPAVAWGGSYGTELPFVAGAGARASGMGLAAITLSGTPSAQYYNPAALSFLDYRALELYRTTLFDSDASYMAASYAHPTLDFGTMAVSLLRIGVGGIEERNDDNELLSSDLSNTQARVLLGYAANVTHHFALGANLKIDHQSLAGTSATGVGVDLGAAVTPYTSRTGRVQEVRAGLMIENLVEPTVKLDADEASDPMRVGAGVSVDALFDRIGVTLATDVVRPRYSPVQFRAGLELGYEKLAAVRVGLDDDTPTFGTGVSYRGVSIDYAFRDEDLGTNHRFSVAVAFGASKEERQRARQEKADAELHERLSTRMHELENEQLAHLVAQADSLLARGDYAGAEAKYGAVLAWDPSNAKAEARRRECRFRTESAEGRKYVESGDYVTALYHYRRADEAQSGDAGVKAQIDLCESKIKDSANRSAMVQTLLARSIDLYAAGDLAAALSGFHDVLRIQPDNTMAAEYERKTVVAIKSAVEKQLARARTRTDRGDFAGATDAINEARALAPADPRIAAELSYLEEKRRAQPAVTASAPSPRVAAPVNGPTVDNQVLARRYRTGVEAFEKGRFDEAARELMAVWTASPGYQDVASTLARAYLFLGMQAYSKGDYDAAIASWERVLTVDPGNAKAQRYLKSSREEASRLGAVSR
jgi:tetratricopeptide (TPR) repeat protein